MRFLNLVIDDPSMESCYEEAVFQNAKNNNENLFWLWRHPKTMWLCNKASLLFLDREYCETNGYPINRSAIIDGRPTSFAITGTSFGLYSLFKISDRFRDVNELNNFLLILYQNICSNYSVNTYIKNNDLLIVGTDKKIAGIGMGMRDNYICSESSFLMSLPIGIDLDRVFKLPREKFEGKSVNSASERMTSLERESQRMVDFNEITKIVKEYLIKENFQIEEQLEFSKQEKDLCESLKRKHRSEEWIKYGECEEKPDFI